MRSVLIRMGRQRGVVAVELALVAIPLAVMTLVAIEFGRAMYTYNTLAKLTRDGARFMSAFDPTIATEYPKEILVNRMLWGKDTPGADNEVLVSGLTAGMITVCDRADASACPGDSFANVATGEGSINLVRVSIEGYRFQPIFPAASGWGIFTFDTISTTMRQVI